MELVAMNGETIPTDIAPSGKEAIAYYKRVSCRCYRLYNPLQLSSKSSGT